MEKWIVYAKKADFAGIGKKFGIDQVVARVIRNRDVIEEEDIRKYLHGNLNDLGSPWLLKGMEEAVDILEQKIAEGKKLRVIGDYDIDGITASYILLEGLGRVGAKTDIYIPDRVADGYGLHEHLIQKAIEDQVDTIVTCDNGISAAHEIQYAKENKMTVIVTDHHDIPCKEEDGHKEYILPPADAVINPKQPGCTYPDKNLCGAVVAFKLVTALYERMGIPQKELERFLQFAAIATVGDVMDLQGENRILVKEGLKRLNRTENKGLKALINANSLEEKEITSYHVGFVLGPCINASGRLDTAMRSLKLLQAQTDEEAERLAEELTELNQTRKALTEEGKEQAIQQVETTELKNDRVLVIYLPDCHESLAGIIAGKIREKYNKPTIVITKGEKSAKGSGCSIEAYSMLEEIRRCSDLLLQFGGHPMAAGLSLEEDQIEEFRRRLNDNCTLTQDDLTPRINIDVPMPISYITQDLVRQFSILEPCGKGNRKPIFAQKDLCVLEKRIVGKNRNVVTVKLSDAAGKVMKGIYFGDAEEFFSFLDRKDRISVVYYPEINSYRGVDSVQIIIEHYM